MHGKMKTLYGIYKKHGREKFLEAAKQYSDHVSDTIEETIAQMESRWYKSSHTLTEADKMVRDYNNGCCSLTSSAPEPGIEVANQSIVM